MFFDTYVQKLKNFTPEALTLESHSDVNKRCELAFTFVYFKWFLFLATPSLLWGGGGRGGQRNAVAVGREAFGGFHRTPPEIGAGRCSEARAIGGGEHNGEAPCGPAERGEPGSSAAAPSSRGPEAAAERHVPLPGQRGPDSVSRGASRRPPRPMRTFVTEGFREPFVRSHRGGRSPPFLAGRRAGKWGGGPPGKGDAEGPAGGGGGEGRK